LNYPVSPIFASSEIEPTEFGRYSGIVIHDDTLPLPHVVSGEPMLAQAQMFRVHWGTKAGEHNRNPTPHSLRTVQFSL